MKKTINLLCSEHDRDALQPVLEQLRERGILVRGTQPAKKGDIVLAVLSESFYADSKNEEALLGLLGAGAENVLPLQLDGAPIPDTLKNALYARNIIPAAGRDAVQIAERIAAAIPTAPPVLPKILIAGAAVLAVIVGLLIWRARQPEETVPVMAEQTEVSYVLPAGWTEEDLEKIVDVIIVGEQVEFYTSEDIGRDFAYPDWDYYAYRDFFDDGAHWFSREDGHEYSLTRYEDLRFLELMPNLRSLTLAKVETGLLPELGKLTRLEHLMLMDCVIPDLEWVRGSSFNNGSINNTTGSITDFSPLSSCARLHHINLDLHGNTQADFSGFAPPALDTLQIVNGQNLQSVPDLSDLSGCAKLRECQLGLLPITDLDFLSGASSMEKLRLENLHQLRDITALAGLQKLKEIYLEDCNQLGDFSPLAECKALVDVNIACDGAFPLRDASFLSGLPQLRNICLGGAELQNIDFLVSLSANRTSLDSFSFWGTIADYSGLAAFKTYNYMSLDPDDGVRLDTILPYLEGAEIQNLCLRRFADVDLSALPRASSRLELDRCGIADLSTMPEDWKASRLLLNKCTTLRSLDGLQNQSRIADLEVYQCPRLTDWSALEGMSLSSLFISGGYTLPDFDALTVTTLHLERMEDVTDLEFLSGMDAERSHSFELIGLDGLNNLQPLSRFHGVYLAVSPQLAEQAEDLVEAGNFQEYRIEYPEGGWEQDDAEMELLSLDELDTLPPALLRRVGGVWIAGDRVIDPDRYEVWEDYADNKGTPILHDRQTDTTEVIPQGSFTDLHQIFQMTGLRHLCVAGQPIAGLDGIQVLSELERIELKCCPELTDVSPLFAMPSLSQISLRGCPGVTSIQGIQNLSHLSRLDLFRVPVSDLSPLAECDLSAAEEQGGFWLEMDDNPVTDFSALSGIQHFSYLCLNNISCDLWLPCLQGVQIDSFSSCNCGFTEESLAVFAAEHPELREIQIPWNNDLTDLTPLLTLDHLERVCVSADMEQAVASLDGQSCSFELSIQD